MIDHGLGKYDPNKRSKLMIESIEHIKKVADFQRSLYDAAHDLDADIQHIFPDIKKIDGVYSIGIVEFLKFWFNNYFDKMKLAMSVSDIQVYVADFFQDSYIRNCKNIAVMIPRRRDWVVWALNQAVDDGATGSTD